MGIFNYSDRTYNTLLADINSNDNLKDKPDWFKQLIAGSHDVLSLAINAAANDLYLDSSYTDQGVDRLCELIDYQRAARTTSSGIVLFDVKRTATFPFTVAVADLVSYSQGSVSVASKRFEATAGVTMSSFTETGTRSGNNLTVARVYTTGELFRIAGGSLPTPLVAATDYYAIYVSDTTIKVAASRTDAYNGTYITLTGAGSGTITLFSKAVTMYQQVSKTNIIIGKSDGMTTWQEFDMPELFILKSSLSITINSLAWTRVDTLVYSLATDRHFKLQFKTDGTAVLIFGNGVYGLIPPAFDIYASYATGGGTDSNISVKDKINVYGGSDSNFTGCSNPSAFSGGSDRETKESAKRLAPILLKTRDRFVTIDDGESLALNYGGIERVKINRNVYGILSAQVVIVPTGGGAPSGALKTALQTYLLTKAIMSSADGGLADIRVVDPTYVSKAFTSAFKVKSGFVFATVKPYYELAVLLTLSEKSQEIKNKLIANGIADTVALINTYWSGTLSKTFEIVDYAAIQILVTQAVAPQFGLSIQYSDVLGYLDSYVDGVDYLTISLPASWPLTFAGAEICQAGTLTTTEIT